MAVRDFLRDHWPAAAISATAAAIGAAAVAMLLGMPPHRIVMATGPEGDAYYETGKGTLRVPFGPFIARARMPTAVTHAHGEAVIRGSASIHSLAQMSPQRGRPTYTFRRD
jgi:hypothetical protein